MKELIKNLLMPLAVFAMLTVGAFTINASEKTDNAVNIESVMDFEVADPYYGFRYIRDLDPITNEYVFVLVDNVVINPTCTLTVGAVRCTIIIDTEEHDLWGESSPGVYAPLYKL
ncbi:hypothetical protein [Myroides odoratimimus]|uniref:hypothetical protein n=1 Tax=Myroides odoratimimus TaxID=76832 RepID=UPI00257821B1|nr:hypothetical protein [Myroides odoratimimus]MDM1506907.1 hypothetical protein [Myroides odoratimimus]MDM1537801.1 hypothetical protein [Myroides odoratimimus]MDM1677356.1 hypothetical protein [Myroides odoratimimus]MEC4086631.1 hypothetical protein [Myroides odoratimimus]